MRDRALHHLGRLQHERQDQLARAELVADVFHRRQQDLVEHVDRRTLEQRLVDLGLDAVLAPAQDRVVDALSTGSSASVGIALAARAVRRRRSRNARSGAAARPGRRLKIRSSHSSRTFGVDLGVRRDLLRMDERAVEAGLDAVMQEHRVERRARGRLEPERDVGDAERRQHAGQLALDQPDAFDRLDGRIERTRRRRSRA